MSSFGVYAWGTSPLAGFWERARPSVTILTPAGVQTGTPVLAFTWSSPIGATQVSYQYQIRSTDGSTVLMDSGTVISGSTSGIAINYLFAGGSEYQLWLRASDSFDTSEWATSNLSVDLVDVNSYPDQPAVGSVYEIGINGIGFMLADRPDRPVQRRIMVLEPPRFSTGETPFTEAVERYTFLGATDWRGGAGQKYLNRTDSDPTKFFDSDGINPFETDCLQLLPSVTQRITDTYATPRMVVAGDRVYVVTGTGELSSRATAAGSTTTFSITGASTIVDMTSDGTNWYACDGASIFRDDGATDPGSGWSSINAVKVEWAVDRLAAVYDDGSNQLCVTTLGPSGTEEVSGGRFKYPNTVSIPDLTAGDGYLWFIVNRANSSQVHFWQIGTDDTYAANGLTLPAGQKATALGFYLGNVFVRAVESLEGGGSRIIIYRCIPSEGQLTPERVLDWTDSGDGSVGGFAGDDRFVLFSWKNMVSTTSGIGAIDLSTGGYAKWLKGGAGDVYSVALWNGKLCYTTAEQGLWVEDSTPVSTGWIETSLSDLGSSLPKVFDDLRSTFDSLPSGATLSYQVTVDGGTSYDTIGVTADTDGQLTFLGDMNLEGRSVGIKMTMSATSVSPKVRSLQVKLHPRLLADQIVVFPINCADRVVGLNGHEIPGNAPGAGLKRTKLLESLTGTRVRLQDIDWPVTGAATVWELMDVSTETIGVFNQKENRRVDNAVSSVTLRRSL